MPHFNMASFAKTITKYLLYANPDLKHESRIRAPEFFHLPLLPTGLMICEHCLTCKTLSIAIFKMELIIIALPMGDYYCDYGIKRFI